MHPNLRPPIMMSGGLDVLNTRAKLRQAIENGYDEEWIKDRLPIGILIDHPQIADIICEKFPQTKAQKALYEKP